MPDTGNNNAGYVLQETGGTDYILLEDGSGSVLIEVPTVKINNYLFVKVGDGMSTSEKIR